jgi:hypothetical protein
MIPVRVRSPFIKEVLGTYGSTQIGTKIILTIWNADGTEPTAGQAGYYSLSKPNASPTQKGGQYNVSNYVREFINNRYPSEAVVYDPPTYSIFAEANNEWCYFRIKAYWVSATADTLISDVVYVGINSFTNYMDGVNQSFDFPTNNRLIMLSNRYIVKKLLLNDVVFNAPSYVNCLIDCSEPAGAYATITYSTTMPNGSPYSLTIPIPYVVGNVQIPTMISSASSSSALTKVEIKVLSSLGALQGYDYFYSQVVEECKYEPVKCQFINRYGGWETLIFYKAQTNSISVKSTDYKFSPEQMNYDVYAGQMKSLNINGTQSVKLNTGWVDENYSELITDLMLSEKVLLDYKPVIVKTQTSDLKSHLNEKNINYTIEFDYAYNLINDVV